MSNINTEPFLNELNNIINISVQNKFNELVEGNKLLEETQVNLVNLPIVKKFYDNKFDKSECKLSCKNTIPDFVTKEDNNKLVSSIEKKMDNYLKNTNELFYKLIHAINELKKEFKNIKEFEKENIKLEIEEVNVENTQVTNLEEDEEDEENEENEECEEGEEVEEGEEEDEEEEEEEDEEVEEVEEDDELEEIKSVETETKESDVDEQEETEEELIEIEIDDVTYCTNDENNGIIYELDKEGNVGEQVGYLKDGEAYFE